jgi:hypothetical protein
MVQQLRGVFTERVPVAGACFSKAMKQPLPVVRQAGVPEDHLISVAQGILTERRREDE